MRIQQEVMRGSLPPAGVLLAPGPGRSLMAHVKMTPWTCHIWHWPYHLTSGLQGREMAGAQALGFHWILILAHHLLTMALGGYLASLCLSLPIRKMGTNMVCTCLREG